MTPLKAAQFRVLLCSSRYVAMFDGRNGSPAKIKRAHDAMCDAVRNWTSLLKGSPDVYLPSEEVRSDEMGD